MSVCIQVVCGEADRHKGSAAYGDWCYVHLSGDAVGPDIVAVQPHFHGIAAGIQGDFAFTAVQPTDPPMASTMARIGTMLRLDIMVGLVLFRDRFLPAVRSLPC